MHIHVTHPATEHLLLILKSAFRILPTANTLPFKSYLERDTLLKTSQHYKNRGGKRALKPCNTEGTLRKLKECIVLWWSYWSSSRQTLLWQTFIVKLFPTGRVTWNNFENWNVVRRLLGIIHFGSDGIFLT